MKNKTFKRLICFLLAFVVMLSLPLDLQANAVATESWMIYALITYLAGMGITFTVTGGVDAMVQAIEEKVKDYEQSNNIIDFYEAMRNRNVRLVPNNNQDPDGNPFFDLFFTASAVEAIQAFVNWLTSQGGFNKGDIYEQTSTISTFPLYLNNNTESTIIYTCQGISETEVKNIYTCDNLGFVYDIDFNSYQGKALLGPSKLYYYNNSGIKCYFTGIAQSTGGWSLGITWRYTTFSGVPYTTSFDVQQLLEDSGYTANDKTIYIDGLTFGITEPSSSRYMMQIYIALNDGKLLYLGDTSYYPQNTIKFSSDVSVTIPDEIPQIKPLPNQGVSIADAISVPMGDPSLIEWGNRIEDIFIETGSIPQPQPEVIADPDYAPAPTPVPTPVPSPEIEDIEDLGLPSLGDAIFNKFPFSLPKDLKRIAVILNAEPVTPFWEVNLFETLGNRVPFVGDTTIRIDLTEYEALGQISRWASVITFVIFLVIITKGVIRW